jgi:hypothetical protein
MPIEADHDGNGGPAGAADHAQIVRELPADPPASAGGHLVGGSLPTPGAVKPGP